MSITWVCSNEDCDYSQDTLFGRYCPWCAQDLEPLCERCGKSLLFTQGCCWPEVNAGPCAAIRSSTFATFT